MREIRNFFAQVVFNGYELHTRVYQRLSIQHGFYHAIRRFFFFFFFLCDSLLLLLDLPLTERVLRTGAGVVGLTGLCRWLHREFSVWQLPVRPASWGSSDGRRYHFGVPLTPMRVGWWPQGLLGKQRSIESIDVDKGRHAKNHNHGCTSKREFIRGIWRWLTLSYNRFFNARRYFVSGLYNLAY